MPHNALVQKNGGKIKLGSNPSVKRKKQKAHKIGSREEDCLLSNNIRVTRVSDSEHGDTEVATAGGTEVGVVAVVVGDVALAEHGVVLNLRLAEGRAVARDDDELSLAAAERLDGGLVAEAVLATLHDKRQLGVDVVRRLLLVLCVSIYQSKFVQLDFHHKYKYQLCFEELHFTAPRYQVPTYFFNPCQKK